MAATDFWNPWHGCTKCSEGCRNCYMYALDARYGTEQDSSKIRLTNNFYAPLKKSRDKSFKIKPGSFLRVNMTSDTFHENALQWLPEFWNIIRQRPDLRFWLLTKRPQNIAVNLPPDWNDGWDNVSLNVSVENQDAIWRAEILSGIPAKHKGICCAPLIGPVDLSGVLQTPNFEEIQCGGENYDNPRPMDIKWAKSLSQQCRNAHVNFCFYETGTRPIIDGHTFFVPKKAEQAVWAFYSGLSHLEKKTQWNLRDPNTGAPVQIPEPMFNKHHCVMCGNRQVCNGCSPCGNCCGPVELVNEAEIRQLDIELCEQIRRKS